MDQEGINGLELLKLLASLSGDDDDEIPFVEDQDEQEKSRKEESGKSDADQSGGRDEGAAPKRKKAELDIVSIQEARRQFEKKMFLGKNTYGKTLADYITDPENNVSGTPSEFHNLITVYFEIGDYYNAHRICRYSLGIYPHSIDLLANAIQASSNACDVKTTSGYLEVAQKIDKKYWNWRLFLFSIKAYRIMMTKCPVENIDAYYEKAYALVKEFQRYIPADERAYNQEAELLLLANDVANARKVLENAIKLGYEYPAGSGRYTRLVAPQCCVTLIDSILEDTDEYDEIIKIAKFGIQFTAQEQPSSSMGYFIYRWAMAEDAMVVKEKYRVRDDVVKALQVYQCAYALDQNRSYKETIKTRYEILSRNPINPVDNMPLEGDKEKKEKKVDVEEKEK